MTTVALRVLFISENIGGHRTVHAHLARALADHPEIASTFAYVPSPGWIRRAAGTRIPGLARLDLDLQALRAKVAAALVTRRMVRDSVARADVVHWYTHNAALLSTDLVRARASVIAVDMTNVQNQQRLPHREPTRFTPAAGRLAVRLEKRVYRAATLVLAKSEWAADSVRGDYGVTGDKVFTHPYGITAGPRQARRAPARPMLLFIGTVMARKGGGRLLSVWRAALRPRCDLTLVTKDAVPPEPGLTVRRDIDAGDGQLAGLLAECTVLVHPSEVDASPHVVFEAMAAGLPVIVTRSGGMPEQVVDGATGLVIPVADDHALLAAITSLLDEPARAEAFGRAGRVLLEERFSVSVTVPRLVEHLEMAWALHSASRPHPRGAG